MTHVLFIQPNLEGIGGIEKVVPVLAQTYQEEGNEVSCLVFYGQVPKEQIFWKHAYALKETRTKHFFHKIYKIILRAKELSAYIKTTNPDCVVVSAQGTSIIVLLAKMVGYISQPVIVYVHQSLHETDLRINFWLMKYVYKYADGFLCVSKGLAQEVEIFTKKHVPVIIAYNPLPEPFSGEVQTPTPFELPIFVTASRLERIKGVDLLTALFSNYFKENKGTLLVLGDGSLKQSLETFVKNEGTSKHIHFLGYTSYVREFYKQATMYVSCAKSEAFGVSLLEALAEGLPVIATDVPYGPREIIGGGISGEYPFSTPYGVLLSPSPTYQELVMAIEKVQKSFFDKNTLQGWARSFTKEAQLASFKELLKRMLQS